MKKLLFTLSFMIVMSFSMANAQDTVTNIDNKKIVTHVSGYNYDVVYLNDDGDILQKGHYYKVGERYKPHGIWKLYDTNTLDLITTASYNKGEQIWVETIIDGNVLHVDQYDLKVKRLEERIVAIEKKVNKQ